MMQSCAKDAEGKHGERKQQQSAHLAATFDALSMRLLLLIQRGHGVTERAAC